MAKKSNKLSEKQIDKTFEMVKGFNIAKEDGSEERFNAGGFVSPEDFEPAVWTDLISAGAVKLFEDPTDLKDGETVAAEIIEE